VFVQYQMTKGRDITEGKARREKHDIMRCGVYRGSCEQNETIQARRSSTGVAKARRNQRSWPRRDETSLTNETNPADASWKSREPAKGEFERTVRIQ
jgi:hypothetical protein